MSTTEKEPFGDVFEMDRLSEDSPTASPSAAKAAQFQAPSESAKRRIPWKRPARKGQAIEAARQRTGDTKPPSSPSLTSGSPVSSTVGSEYNSTQPTATASKANKSAQLKAATLIDPTDSDEEHNNVLLRGTVAPVPTASSPKRTQSASKKTSRNTTRVGRKKPNTSNKTATSASAKANTAAKLLPAKASDEVDDYALPESPLRTAQPSRNRQVRGNPGPRQKSSSSPISGSCPTAEKRPTAQRRKAKIPFSSDGDSAVSAPKATVSKQDGQKSSSTQVRGIVGQAGVQPNQHSPIQAPGLSDDAPTSAQRDFVVIPSDSACTFGGDGDVESDTAPREGAAGVDHLVPVVPIGGSEPRACIARRGEKRGLYGEEMDQKASEAKRTKPHHNFDGTLVSPMDIFGWKHDDTFVQRKPEMDMPAPAINTEVLMAASADNAVPPQGVPSTGRPVPPGASVFLAPSQGMLEAFAVRELVPRLTRPAQGSEDRTSSADPGDQGSRNDTASPRRKISEPYEDLHHTMSRITSVVLTRAVLAFKHGSLTTSHH